MSKLEHKWDEPGVGWGWFDETDAGDGREETWVSGAAEAFVRWSLDRRHVAKFTLASSPFALRVMAYDPHGEPAYLTEVRGQSSASGHGKQGAHPVRLAWLRQWADENGVPVRVVFVETPNKDMEHQKWETVVLDVEEPEVAMIDLTPERKRQGWRVRDLERGEGAIPFPVILPRPAVLAQGRLG